MGVFRKYLQSVSVVAAVLAIGGFWLLRGASAAGGQIYVSPATSSVNNGSNVSVALRITPPSAVDSVTVTLNYDPAKLQFVSPVNYGGSPFTVQLPETIASGSITINTGMLSGSVSSDALLANFTFKALVGSGTGSLTVSSPQAWNSGSAVTVTAGNGSVNFTTPTVTPPPAPAPPPSTGGTPTGTTGGTVSTGTTKAGSSSSTSSGAKASTPAPTSGSTQGSGSTSAGVDISQQIAEYTHATITAVSKVPTKAYIRYGLDSNSLNLSTPLSDFALTHSLSLDPATLLPGATYYYQVVATDQQGKTVVGPTQTITTKGFTVNVAIYDKNHNPIANKKVTLHSTPMTATTNAQGVAVFNNVAPGNHQVIYTDGKDQLTQAVAVANNVVTAPDGSQTAAAQNLAVVYKVVQHPSIDATRWLIVGLIGLAAVVVLYAVVKRAGRLATAITGPPIVSSSEVITGANGGVNKSSLPGQTASQQIEPNTPIKIDVSQELNNIATPTTPQPGTTITPKDEADEQGRQ